MPTIFIDGQSYEVSEGDNLLQAVQGLGLELPYFCWHPALGSVGACRQCAVVQYLHEDDTRGRIVMGCMTPVTEGARFSMNAEKATGFRENVIESLMLNHPHDCPVCAEGGECHLQDMTVMAGHRDRHYRGKKNTYRNQDLGPLISHEMNRCITCYRCERFYRDYAGGTDLAAQASHDHVYFGRHQDGVLESEFSGNLVEVCPTGVFTDKPLVNDYTRKWDLQSAPSICTACAVGCNTTPGERYGRLKRTHNRYNAEVNGYFLCDRGRFGGDQVNSDDRLDYAGLRNSDGSFDAINASAAMAQCVQWCGGSNKVAAIGSPRASLETNYLARQLVGENNFCLGFSDDDNHLIQHASYLLNTSAALIPSLKQVEEADAILILGEDVTQFAPRLALSLRQSVRNKALEMGAELQLQPWQDAAIRNLAQEQRSPLFIASVAATRLDDVAESQRSLSPKDIAKLAMAVAAKIDTTLASVDVSKTIDEWATSIATALNEAKTPLIVTGTGCQSQAVLDAAALVANSLASRADKQANNSAMLSVCLPECNSLGLAMLAAENKSPSLSELSQRAQAGEIDTVLICENDLYRRGAHSDIDQLLDGVKHVIVLDSHETATANRAHLVMPIASFAETEATLINSEGRAQRSYPVFEPSAERIESWRLLVTLAKALAVPGFSDLKHFDQVTQRYAKENDVFSALADSLAEHSEQRINGMKIARQPNRYSGRTAMNAGVSMHEPQQTIDEETPLSYSMEGFNGDSSSSPRPFVWSPGWNSNQSLQTFDNDHAGAEAAASSIYGAGVRLISPSISSPSINTASAKASASDLSTAGASDDSYTVVPIYRIFGSEELSVKSAAIAELTEPAFLLLHPDTAAQLSVVEGDGVTLAINGAGAVQGSAEPQAYEIKIDQTLAAGCVGYSAGFSDMAFTLAGSIATLAKTSGWQRRKPVLIASDGGS